MCSTYCLGLYLIINLAFYIPHFFILSFFLLFLSLYYLSFFLSLFFFLFLPLFLPFSFFLSIFTFLSSFLPFFSLYLPLFLSNCLSAFPCFSISLYVYSLLVSPDPRLTLQSHPIFIYLCLLWITE